MNHSVAIEVLKDELEDIEKQCEYLSRGISGILLSQVVAPKSIREHALVHRKRVLAEKQHDADALKASIKFLEEAMRRGDG